MARRAVRLDRVLVEGRLVDRGDQIGRAEVRRLHADSDLPLAGASDIDPGQFLLLRRRVRIQVWTPRLGLGLVVFERFASPAEDVDVVAGADVDLASEHDRRVDDEAGGIGRPCADLRAGEEGEHENLVLDDQPEATVARFDQADDSAALDVGQPFDFGENERVNRNADVGRRGGVRAVAGAQRPDTALVEVE